MIGKKENDMSTKYDIMVNILDNYQEQLITLTDMVKNLEKRLGLVDYAIDDLYVIKKTKREYRGEV